MNLLSVCCRAADGDAEPGSVQQRVNVQTDSTRQNLCNTVHIQLEFIYINTRATCKSVQFIYEQVFYKKWNVPVKCKKLTSVDRLQVIINLIEFSRQLHSSKYRGKRHQQQCGKFTHNQPHNYQRRKMWNPRGQVIQELQEQNLFCTVQLYPTERENTYWEFSTSRLQTQMLPLFLILLLSIGKKTSICLPKFCLRS